MAEDIEIQLTAKQKLFADFYVGEANLNATRAAIMAGYSEKTAYSIASENLRKPEISSYINKRLDEIAMTSREILAGFTFEAKGSIADVLEPDGSFDYEKMCSRGSDKLVKEFKITKTVRKVIGSDKEIEEETKHEFKLYDSQSAKAHLAKVRGLFVEKHELTGANGGAIETNQTLNLKALSTEDLLKLEEINRKLLPE